MKLRHILVGLALTSIISTAIAYTLPDNIKESGKIIVANKPNYPPLEYKDPLTGKLKGLDIDLGEALGKELGVKIEWMPTSFEQMPSSLTTGRIDLILSGMNDNQQRRDFLNMVDYMKSGVQIYTLKANSSKFRRPSDLCGQKVGMSRLTKYPALVTKWSKKNCSAAGKPDIIIAGSDGSADARSQLKQGRIVAAVQGPETLPYIMSQEPDTYVLVGPPIVDLLNGIGVAKKNTVLLNAVAGALKKLMADGQYHKILAKHDLEDRALSGVMINGEPIK